MGQRLNLGDRIKVHQTWSDVDGALGTVAEPPDHIRSQSGFGSNYFREETSLTGSKTTLYWIELDVPDVQSGAAEAGEFGENELEKV